MSGIGAEVRIWAILIAALLTIIGTIVWITIGWQAGIVVLLLAFGAGAFLYLFGDPRVQAKRDERQNARRMTARQLRGLPDHGHRVLHGRALSPPRTKSSGRPPAAKEDDSGELDHLIVGPTGVYTLSSAYLRPELRIRTQYLDLFHGPNSQRKLLERAQRDANLTAQSLSQSLGLPVDVTPVAVIHGPHVPWKVLALRGVDVLSGKRVRRYVESRRRKLSTVEVQRIAAAAEEVLPARSPVPAGAPNNMA